MEDFPHLSLSSRHQKLYPRYTPHGRLVYNQMLVSFTTPIFTATLVYPAAALTGGFENPKTGSRKGANNYRKPSTVLGAGAVGLVKLPLQFTFHGICTIFAKQTDSAVGISAPELDFEAHLWPHGGGAGVA